MSRRKRRIRRRELQSDNKTDGAGCGDLSASTEVLAVLELTSTANGKKFQALHNYPAFVGASKASITSCSVFCRISSCVEQLSESLALREASSCSSALIDAVAICRCISVGAQLHRQSLLRLT